MIGPRFFALLATGREACLAWREARTVSRAALVDFDLTVCGDRLAVLVDAQTSFAIGDDGFVVGDVFQRGDRKRLATLDSAEAGKVIASGGEWLALAYWGSYVALFGKSDSDSVCVDVPLFFHPV